MQEDDEIAYLPLVEVGRRIAARQLSPVAVTGAMLARIERLQPKLRAYATVMAESALAEARAAEAEIAAGRRRGPLHGVPLAVKDLCYTAGAPTAAGMKIHRDFRPTYDATVVARLRRAGAVILGKLQMTEGAYADHHPDVAPPLNPWNADYWCGSSSSGSGVATATGQCFGSIGSDTGGSIRFPCDANGITGLKPTWGRVSRHGIFPLSESLDHIGPMTRSAEDAAAMMQAIAGHDPADPTSVSLPVPDYLAELSQGIAGIRIGVDASLIEPRCSPDVAAAFRQAVGTLAALGAVVVEAKCPDLRPMVDGWAALCGSETALAHAATYPARADEYGTALKGLIELGRATTGPALADVLIARDRFREELRRLFDSIDLLALPAQPIGPVTLPRRAELRRTPETSRALQVFTAPFDLSGSPTLTLPCGISGEGLPIGFQLVGRHFEEGLTLRAGHAFQLASDWHLRRPPV